MFETENGTLENVFFALDSSDAVLILNSVFLSSIELREFRVDVGENKNKYQVY